MKTSKINAQEIINKNCGYQILCISGKLNYGVLINEESNIIAADNIDISSLADDEISVEMIDTDEAVALYVAADGKQESEYSGYDYVKITVSIADSVEQYVLPTTGW